MYSYISKKSSKLNLFNFYLRVNETAQWFRMIRSIFEIENEYHTNTTTRLTFKCIRNSYSEQYVNIFRRF